MRRRSSLLIGLGGSFRVDSLEPPWHLGGALIARIQCHLPAAALSAQPRLWLMATCPARARRGSRPEAASDLHAGKPLVSTVARRPDMAFKLPNSGECRRRDWRWTFTRAQVSAQSRHCAVRPHWAIPRGTSRSHRSTSAIKQPPDEIC